MYITLVLAKKCIFAVILDTEEIKVVRYAHRFQKTHFVLKKGDPYQEIKSQIFEGVCQFLSFEFEQNANF